MQLPFPYIHSNAAFLTVAYETITKCICMESSHHLTIQHIRRSCSSQHFVFKQLENIIKKY